jgi:hypothetical protein
MLNFTSMHKFLTWTIRRCLLLFNMYVCIYVRYIYVCMYVCIYIRYMYVCMYLICMYVYMYVRYMYVCMYIFMYCWGCLKRQRISRKKLIFLVQCRVTVQNLWQYHKYFCKQRAKIAAILTQKNTYIQTANCLQK